MNWNIFKRLRAVEVDHNNTDASLGVLIERVNQRNGQLDRDRLIATTELGFLRKLVDQLRARNDVEHNALFLRLDKLEQSAIPAPAAAIKTAAEKLLKAQAYRRAYYQKKKAEAAADLAIAYDRLKGLK